MTLKQLTPLFEAITKAHGKPFVVGGFVRDTLMGLDPKDIDIEVHEMDVFDLIDLLKRFGKVDEVGKSFGVLKLRFKGMDLDISMPRTERKLGQGHTDFAIDVNPFLGIKKALARRDFTINAMAFDMTTGEPVLVDPFGGASDIKAGVLRHVGPAFAEDPLRVLRAVQFAARFGMVLATDTILMCRSLVPELLSTISDERIWGEFEKIGAKGRDLKCFAIAIEDVGLQGVFGIITKPRFATMTELTGELDGQSIRIPLVLAACGVDPDKFRAMPKDVARDIRDLQLAAHTTWGIESSRRIARQFRRITFLDALRIRPSLSAEVDPRVWTGPIPVPVTGFDLIEAGIKPGPGMGEKLAMITAFVDRDPDLTKEDAISLALQVG